MDNCTLQNRERKQGEFIVGFKNLILMAGLFLFQANGLFAHTVDYFSTCGYACSGSALTINAKISNANSSSKYNWQYRDNTGIWKCFVNGSNTINGVGFTVSGATGTGTLTDLPVTIQTATVALENVEVRLLIADDGTPCATNASYTIWGHDKMLRLHVLSASDCGTIASNCGSGGCNGNVLNDATGYYGGFESGSISPASSDYTLFTTAPSSCKQYKIVNNVQQAISSFPLFAPRSGNWMLYADGSSISSNRVWYRAVTVAAGNTYQFSAWIANANTTSNQKASISLKVNGTTLTGATATVSSTAGAWIYITGNYVATASGTVTLQIYDNNTSCTDNDFVLDDLCFKSLGGSVNLGNIVWNDYDGDGIKDVAEPKIPGLTVSLYSDNNSDNLPDGAAIGTTVTDASGYYSFTSLVAGRYIVSIPVLEGYTKSPNTATQSTSPNPDNDVDNDNNGVNEVGGILYSNATTLSVGGEPTTDGDNENGNLTLDMALCGNGFIGDYVWNDLNANGIQEAGEPGINGATVTITFSDGTTASTLTSFFNNDGYYDFKNLGPANYIITFSTPSGFYVSPSDKGADETIDSDPVNGSVNVTLVANASNLTIDAGFTNIAPTGGGAECFGLGNVGCQTCAVAYPDNSNLPRSAVVFNESEVLRYAEPGPSTCGTATSEIRMWYSDEHAMTLGVRSVVVKTTSGTTTTNYPLTPTPSTPGCVINPLVGTTISSGDQSGNDVADGGGRPLMPALFITDLTANGSTSRAGDWQQGGTPVAPQKVCGTWKGAVRTVDKTRNPAVITVTPDANPSKNNWTLGTGSDMPAVGFGNLTGEGYGAEVVWKVADLGLLPGHTYRLQFMVHDGDQNKTGGDVGQSCTTIVMGGNPNQSGTDGTVKSVWTINPNNTVTIKTTLDKTLVDNTYGTNVIGWPAAHTFTDMVTADNMQMQLFDATGTKKMDFKMDYISASAAAPSGYKSLGVSGGDGSVTMGSASDVVSVKTSLDSNLNEKGYVLTSNSPATNSTYTPNATYPNWNFNVVYEATINLSAFGAAGFGYPKVLSLNVSPSKIGRSDISVLPSICPGFLTLGNLVWNDLNSDGMKDSNESGIVGAIVNLYADNNGDNVPDGAAIASTTTDANGLYRFSNLLPGKFIVGVVLPTGYTYGNSIATSTNPNNNIDNDNNGIVPVGPNTAGSEERTNAITLTTLDNLTLDLALNGSATIGNFVWHDYDRNGIQDAGEPGFSGVTVRLTNSSGVVLTTTTESTGFYQFSGLLSGNYSVCFTTPVPSAFIPSPVNQGTDDALDSDPIGGCVNVTLAIGETNNDVDAGYYDDIDDDDDGILDIIEGKGYDAFLDCDNDGIPNYLDVTPGCTTPTINDIYGKPIEPLVWTDCDGDNVNDFFDFDRDGIINELDLDSDNDGILDAYEARDARMVDVNNDGMVDGLDNDGDGLRNSADLTVEIYGGPSLFPQNLDRDSLANYLDLDSDGDGLSDITEAKGTFDTDGLVNGIDTDGDGVNDGADGIAGPGAKGYVLMDNDNDLKPNPYDIDSDNDGITDNVEGQPTCNEAQPSGQDDDGDGIENVYDAFNNNCLPKGGGITPYDKDFDGIPDIYDLDTDNDGVPDANEGSGLPGNFVTNFADADGDGLIDQFDIFDISLQASEFWRNVGHSNMGPNGNTNGPFPAGSNASLPGENCPSDRDWRNVSILPIRLLSFKGDLSEKMVTLHWTVSNEVDMNQYIVERSTDGLVWNDIKSIKAQNISGQITYTTTDNVNGISSTVVLYRLRQIEKSGSMKRSITISFKLLNYADTRMVISPNPVRTYFNININSTKEELATIRMNDAAGRIVWNQKRGLSKGINVITFNNMNKLSDGTYYVQVILQDETFNQKLVIVK